MRQAVLLTLIAHVAMGAEYAVLVAGSNGFWNYRHQADICHAYQVLVRHGFDPENIILFSYDDVPTDSWNQIQGSLFNHPGNFSVDVNVGCNKDYTGDSVNVSNFIAVMTGNASAVQGGNGRVLQSGPEDNVFVNFVDHGAPGLVAFPDTLLYADQLNDTLTYMYEHGMYKQLVFYLEACESGSMFDGILSDSINVYATTAAGTDEPSWSTYCYPDENINGIDLYTCLGDLYSVNWMEDSDAADFSSETLYNQFLTVRTLTNRSEVHEYGNLAIAQETLGEFQGPASHQGIPMDVTPSVYWNSYEAKVNFLYTVFSVDPSDSNTQALIAELTYEQGILQTFQLISEYLDPSGTEGLLYGDLPVRDFACLRASVETYQLQCGQLQDYALQYVQVLVNACEAGHSLAQMNGAFSEACTAAKPQIADLPLAYWGLEGYLESI